MNNDFNWWITNITSAPSIQEARYCEFWNVFPVDATCNYHNITFKTYSIKVRLKLTKRRTIIVIDDNNNT